MLIVDVNVVCIIALVRRSLSKCTAMGLSVPFEDGSVCLTSLRRFSIVFVVQLSTTYTKRLFTSFAYTTSIAFLFADFPETFNAFMAC